jgi:hypothetical protein
MPPLQIVSLLYPAGLKIRQKLEKFGNPAMGCLEMLGKHWGFLSTFAASPAI